MKDYRALRGGLEAMTSLINGKRPIGGQRRIFVTLS